MPSLPQRTLLTRSKTRLGGVFTQSDNLQASQAIDVAALRETGLRVLVPKSGDARPSATLFTELTGIEVPGSLWENEFEQVGNVSFRLAPGADIPGQLAAGWGDIGISSTELTANSGKSSELSAFRLSTAPICWLALIALRDAATEWREFLAIPPDERAAKRTVPTAFPLFVRRIVLAQGLPIDPADVPVRGKAEALLNVGGIRAVADRVVTGTSAKRQGGEIVDVLAPIFPELLVANRILAGRVAIGT